MKSTPARQPLAHYTGITLSPAVSIIVPTLNERENIDRQAERLCELPACEIIFCDGGSSDGTAEWLRVHARQYSSMRLLHSPCGRARQMNAAAACARGDWLLFLHADTILPPASFRAFLYATQNDAGMQSGAFSFRIDHSRHIYRLLEFYVGVRCRLLKLPFGDQAIFVRKSLFEKLGGYRDDFPLMEDLEFVQRLKKHTGFRILTAPVFTSARRYENDGYFKRACGNAYLQFLYQRGVHPQKLAKRYWNFD